MPPDSLLINHAFLLRGENLEGPVLDLASGKGQNGLYVAELGLPVILADRNPEALQAAQKTAYGRGLQVTFWEVDLETGQNPLKGDHYRAILVFRYLHRPLIPCIKKAIKPGGILIYETFTNKQPCYGRPHNPDHLLKPEELLIWFKDWEVIHYFEGLLEDPPRSMAQLVCRKPIFFPKVKKNFNIY
jgi:tellurite methyltransferase